MGSPAAGRTTLEFEYDESLWGVVDTWAAENGFRQVGGTDDHRRLQKGRGFLVAPMMCEIRQQGHQVTLVAWIRVNLLIRLFGLFLIPSEMGIASGGFKLSAPRKIARNAINRLLQQLSQDPVS